MDREEMLRECFQQLDRDGSGTIEMLELNQIVGRMTPAKASQEAKGWMDYLDLDGNGEVTEEEFLAGMGSYFEFVDDDMFLAGVEEIKAGQEIRMGYTDFEEQYKHPSNNKEYLRDIVPVLQEALEALGGALQQNRVEVAAGVDWEDGYMPEGWERMNPLAWLGDWLLDYDAKVKAALNAPKEEPPKIVMFCDMTRDEKLALALTREGPALSLDDLLSKMIILMTSDVIESFKQRCPWMESAGDTMIEIAAVIPDILKMCESQTAEEFDAHIYKCLDYGNIDLLNTKEKLSLAFHHLDFDDSGELEMDELEKFGLMINPYADTKKLQASMQKMDLDGSGAVDLGEFIESMSLVMGNDAKVNSGVKALLDAAMMAREREWGPAKDLAPAFAKSVLSNPYFKKVPQMGSEEVELYLKAEDKTVVFVDARPAVMTKVSTIPEALIVPVSFGVEDGMKKLIVDEERLKELPNATLEGADVIVAYCGTGIRGCLLTEALVKLKPGKKVANLCGGLIDWYNRMHKVVNGAGEEVKAIHPGSKGATGFIERQNEFRFPVARSPKSSKASSKGGSPKSKS